MATVTQARQNNFSTAGVPRALPDLTVYNETETGKTVRLDVSANGGRSDQTREVTVGRRGSTEIETVFKTSRGHRVTAESGGYSDSGLFALAPRSPVNYGIKVTINTDGVWVNSWHVDLASTHPLSEVSIDG